MGPPPPPASREVRICGESILFSDLGGTVYARNKKCEHAMIHSRKTQKRSLVSLRTLTAQLSRINKKSTGGVSAEWRGVQWVRSG